jgi:hypothetical protein
MPNACEKPMLGIADVTRNACAAGIFVVIASRRQEAIVSIAPLHGPPKARRVDSESRFLAIKKFLRSVPLRLIDARQNRFFARIARG